MMTQFEDLSNEILYEIFDYLDDIYVSEIFSNLNYRFFRLIHQCCLPLKVSLSYESLKNFTNRFQTLLHTYKHRLQSLRISDCFFLEKFQFNSSLIRLQALNFEGIQYSPLIFTLQTCIQLPSLHSLTFNCTEKVQYPDRIYSLIFSFPVLKFCQLSFNIINQEYEFLFDDFILSPIEQLIINSNSTLKNLIGLISFTPNLSHLFCQISNSLLISELSIVNKNLTNLSLKFDETSFDEFEWFLKNLLSPIQILKISTKHDREFLNPIRWQHILTQQTPLLRKFIFEYCGRQDILLPNDIIDQFQSSFWIEKQWFFAYQYYLDEYSRRWIRFYSIKPYKWKTYRFDENLCSNTEFGINLTYEVDLHNYQSIPYRFPNANRLILSKGNLIHFNEIFSHFSCRQLIELIIFDEQIRLEHLFTLITYLPNLKNLTIHSNNLILISPQSETHRIIFPQNHISKITINNQCTLQDIQIILRVCPILYMLDIEINNEQIESTLNILLLKRICHLNLCFRDIQFRFVKKFQTLIKRDYLIHYIDQKIFLWCS